MSFKKSHERPVKPIDKNHFLFLKKLVLLEENEENEEIKNEFLNLSPSERELRGKALLGLRLCDTQYSPAGHLLLTFRRQNEKALPLFSLEVGDLVSLFPETQPKGRFKKGEYPQGTLYEKTKESLTVALNGALPPWAEDTPSFQMHKSVNRVTYRRMLEALDAVYETENTRLAVFRDISFGGKEALFFRKSSVEGMDWFDSDLNASQKEAVKKSVLARDVTLVHGPPGTGKTRVLIEIIRQLVSKKESVFVTAPSNTACDNLLERLVEKKVNAVRLGHPARITAALREHTLDFKLALHPVAKIIVQKESELHRLYKKEQKNLKSRISELKYEIKSLEKEVVTRVMGEAQVFVGTLTGIREKLIREKLFDCVLVDEATQATEPMTWIPAANTKRLIMAGDHFQLPPTVRCKEAEEKGLGVTLFERFYKVLGPKSKQLLERQYRMNEKIMGFSSRKFYENLLIADESVRRQTLAELPKVERCQETEEPLLFIDTAGKGFEEKLEEGSQSRFNPEEAFVVLDQLKKMLAFGVRPSEIAVISPYSAQVRLLTSESPHPDVEIDSVDGFQGREKELVILSLVRSNNEGELGFLGDTRRMNVAMTRARRKLIVIGDSATLSSISFYKDFISYAEEVGGYKSVWEL